MRVGLLQPKPALVKDLLEHAPEVNFIVYLPGGSPEVYPQSRRLELKAIPLYFSLGDSMRRHMIGNADQLDCVLSSVDVDHPLVKVYNPADSAEAVWALVAPKPVAPAKVDPPVAPAPVEPKPAPVAPTPVPAPEEPKVEAPVAEPK